jgi:MerR family transcriptional regulator/heat shock protein HspR
MHPQTLRKYEREGLIAPSRTQGNLRLYSDRDIERLRQVKYLVEDRGLNLAGVQMALELTRRLRELRGASDRLQKESSRASIGGGASEAFGALRDELDAVLVSLGFVPEPPAQQRRAAEEARA